VKVKDETWNTHQWLSNPRRLAVEPSNAVLQHHCVRCGRDFVTDSSSNDSYAVFVSAISFDQLEDEVTKRWLGEPCRGRRLSSDDEDRNRIVAAFTISQGGGLSRVRVYEKQAGGLIARIKLCPWVNARSASVRSDSATALSAGAI
jgi:hypothetical protein